MNNSELTVFSMLWLVEYAPVLLVLLLVLVPVLAIAVAGYAVHVVGRRQERGKK